MKPVFFESAAGFRWWLQEHHARERELVVGLCKKGARRGVTYPEALDEALAFGWIDGVRRGIDASSFSVRFTPRKRGSIWSAVNIRRVQELMREGRMKPSGLRSFQERDERKTRLYSYERKPAVLDAELAARLRANRKASAFFDAQPSGYRRLAVHWIMSAKKEETRERRFRHLVDRSASGARIDLARQFRSGAA